MVARATPVHEQVTWTPGMTMYTNTQVQVINLELPGVKMRDVHMSVEPEVLTVSGTGPRGVFLRRVPLRYKVPLDRVQVHLCQGVLEIRVPNPAVFSERRT